MNEARSQAPNADDEMASDLDRWEQEGGAQGVPSAFKDDTDARADKKTGSSRAARGAVEDAK